MSARSVLRGVAASAAATSLLLVLVEAGSCFALRVNDRRARSQPLPERTATAYRGLPWADTFWREQRQVLSYELRPFGLWRSRPFAGETIHVDDRGLRRTPGSRCGSGELSVFVFGGSTVWGYGSPDWETIPSLLARRFAEDGSAACVVNYGEDSWSSAQGVVQLILELRLGAKADRVIFLNGCNDVFTPFFLTGRADREWEFVRSKALLEAIAEGRGGGFGYLAGSNTYALAKRLAKKLRGYVGFPKVPDPDGLARDVVASWLRDADLVASLGSSHGFRTAFFWQPLASSGKHLSAEEEAGARRQMGQTWPLSKESVGRVQAALREASLPPFVHDLSSAFDDANEDVYLDVCHLLPAGNRMLAERIYQAVK